MYSCDNFVTSLANKHIYGSPLIVNLNRILDVNLLNPALDANCQNLVPLVSIKLAGEVPTFFI